MGCVSSSCRCGRYPTLDEVAALDALVARSQTPFEPDGDAAHLALLQELWSTFHDNVRGVKRPFERASQDWLKIGFQNADPVSDVRGGGVLAVENMLAFVKSAPDTAIAMAESGEHDDEDIMTACYMPWATAGVNITRLLLEVFGAVGSAGQRLDPSRSKKRFWPLVFDFDALYVLSFELLDATFDEEHGTYMAFPHVKDTVRCRLSAALDKFGPSSVSELQEVLHFHYHPKQLPDEEKERIRHARRAALKASALAVRAAVRLAAPARVHDDEAAAPPGADSDAAAVAMAEDLASAPAPAPTDDEAAPQGLSRRLFRRITRMSSAGSAMGADKDALAAAAAAAAAATPGLELPPPSPAASPVV